MATTQKQQKQDAEEFAQSFDTPDQEAPEQSEDQAFGITPPEVSADDGQGDGTPAAVSDSTPEGGESAPEAPAESQAEEAAEPAAEEATETPAAESAEAATEEPSQQEKSWEGRLRKREEELAAREAALKEKEGALGDASEPAAEVQDVVEDVQSGKISAEDARQKLAEDFGPEFVDMIDAIASASGANAIGDHMRPVAQNVDAIISHIRDEAARRHFEELAGAHPDFAEVATAPEFQVFLSTRPEEMKATDKATLENGSAKEIIALLDAYKKGSEQVDNSENQAIDEAADAGEGVRSNGIKLPETPTASDDYDKAWDEA